MIVTPKSFADFTLERGRKPTHVRYLEEMYAAYRNELVYEFRAKYPRNCRINYNYTRGFSEDMIAWCDALDPDWGMLQHFGHDWPVGFSNPDFLFAFKMRWL